LYAYLKGCPEGFHDPKVFRIFASSGLAGLFDHFAMYNDPQQFSSHRRSVRFESLD
jgi:hypothetical protein